MPVLISSVTPGSAAACAGIIAGDLLESINENQIIDVLDYRFHSAVSRLKLVCLHHGERKQYLISKDEYEDIGLDFENYLMDAERGCKNKCVFCFIDQLPKGMRKSVYYKDDDMRLSFLLGNYITLTNLPLRDIERIIKMKISPLNISVHAVSPKVREAMMGNPRAVEAKELLKKFANQGITMNCQLVICPGINDGEVLRESLEYLCSLYPKVQSIAVVPVGLSGHREGLFPLCPVDKQAAQEILDICGEFGELMLLEYNDRVIYPADELFLLAGRKIPPYEYYGDFLQLENGVGLMALFEDEYLSALENAKFPLCDPSKKTVITGVAAYPFICSLLDVLSKKWHNERGDGQNIDISALSIKNNFFGGQVDVAGLVCGGDIIAQAKNIENPGEILIPSCMLRSDQDIFLDDVTPDELSAALNSPVRIVPVNGEEFLSALLS